LVLFIKGRPAVSVAAGLGLRRYV